MSTGPGTIQRAIIAAVEEYGPSPLPWIAEQAGFDITKLAVRQSFARAANVLYARDAVQTWTARWPSKVTVVAKADTEPSEAEFELAMLRHVEMRNPDLAKHIRYEAAATDIESNAYPERGIVVTEAQKLIVADNVRINRLADGNRAPVFG